MLTSKFGICGKIATRTPLSLLAILLWQPITRADVTITQRLGWNGHSPQSEWARRIMIKGNKLKIESERDNKIFVTLYDLDVGQESLWDSKGNAANVFDLSVVSAKLEKAMKRVRTTVQPTGQIKKTPMGSCEQFSYEIFIALPRHMVNGVLMAPVEHETGTMCVSRDVRGSKEFADFAQAAKARGYILGSISEDLSSIDPSSALFLAAADLNGVVLERFANSEAQGGPGVGFYGTAASNEFHAIVTDITNSPLADEGFRIPDGRKIHKDRSMSLSVPVNYQSKSAPSSYVPKDLKARD